MKHILLIRDIKKAKTSYTHHVQWTQSILWENIIDHDWAYCRYFENDSLQVVMFVLLGNADIAVHYAAEKEDLFEKYITFDDSEYTNINSWHELVNFVLGTNFTHIERNKPVKY